MTTHEDTDRMKNYGINANKMVFISLSLCVVLINVFMINFSGLDLNLLTEIAVLTDFSIVIPIIYVVCFRYHLRRAVIKVIGLVCLGVWGASVLMPESQQQIIQEISVIRFAGIGVLLFIELKIIISIWKSLFKGSSKETVVKNITQDSDMPPWLAQLLVWETSLWLKLGKLVGIFKKTD